MATAIRYISTFYTKVSPSYTKVIYAENCLTGRADIRYIQASNRYKEEKSNAM